MLKKLLRFVLISFGVLALGFTLLIFVAVRAEKNEQKLAEESGFESVSQMEIAQSAGFDTGEGYKQHLAELQAQQEAEAERLALEAEARRLAEVEAAKDAARQAEERKKELTALTNHIVDGGSYAFIEISDIDGALFEGKTCSEALDLRATIEPVQGSHPFGFAIDGSTLRIAALSTEFSFGANAPIYSMPKNCNLLADPDTVERTCGLDDPKYILQAYKRDENTNLVTEFGKVYCNGCLYQQPEDIPWTVVSKMSQELITSYVVRLQTDAQFEGSSLKIDRRAYVCKN